MTPYLSIVTTARNDNHGGNMLHRMQIFVNGVLAQSAKYRLNTELIVVEWNPLLDKPRLAQELSWPETHDFCTVRVIEVSPEVHKRYRHADRLPLYQMIAKNVGIRRACGEFVLATNIDILFSDELFAFLAAKKLIRGKMYRTNRHDISPDIPTDISIDEQLAQCRKKVFRINNRHGTINMKTGEYNQIYPDDIDANPLVYLDTVCVPLHTNACGDFHLMARENWEVLYGYPELDMFSFHLDSVLSYMAHYGGATEEILLEPMCIYHIEHTAGWTPETEKNKTFDQKLKTANIRRLSDEEFQKLVVKMTLEKRHIILSDNDWGLASESLPEHIVIRSGQYQGYALQHEDHRLIQANIIPPSCFSTKLSASSQPAVSIITISLNNLPHLKNCINSVISQDYPHIEHVIYDRGSTDGTIELLRKYGNRITWASLPELSHGESIISALRRCKGEIISICNPENEFLPHAASWAVHSFAALPDIAAIYGDYYEIDNNGEILQVIPGPVSYIYEQVLCNEITIPTHTTFFSRPALGKTGLLEDSRFPATCEDFALWTRLGLISQLVHVPCVVSKCCPDELQPRTQNHWHEIYLAKKEFLEHFFLESDVSLHFKALFNRAMGGLALATAAAMLEYCRDNNAAMKYVQIARDYQPDSDHLNQLGEIVLLYTEVIQERYKHGIYLYQIRKYEEALSFFETFSVLDYWFYGIQYSKAMCLLQLGNMADAVTALENELLVHPDHKNARELLRQIHA